MKIDWWEKQDSLNWSGKFFPIRLSVNIKNLKVYKEVIFSGIHDDNQSALQEATDLIKKLSSSKDSTFGVKVIFTSKTKYEDLVGVLDLGNIYPNVYHLLYDDKVYFWANKPYPIEKSIDYPKLPPDHFDYAKPVSEANFNFEQIIPFWPSALALLAMIFFWNKRKTNQIIN